MIVCICRRVSDRDIEREVRSGCRSFEGLQSRLGVATGCGTCADHARKAFECRRAESCGRADESRRLRFAGGALAEAGAMAA